MEPTKEYLRDPKAGPFPELSLFLKGYLRNETLQKDQVLAGLLVEKEQGRIVNPQKWMFRLRTRLLECALREFKERSGRPVNLNELLHMDERIDEFVQLYVLGLRT